ncbi:hypothetical protein STCU_03628 [Strigomonas culicis]|uniref:Uncharacterized protein n=1 Tax=Strigomonas culicis TaxID=28005 RepID=S9UQP0_9TRYP|nr:hypothetical protein STCU_05734 [Strigomonas culicis]EPY31089.1 hypothetical protein STCU_03628 [Strigomonas culicis]|eukprot:EPY27471.1 hypothetical protein STCU_05734 [Strigomonas culicis]
MTAPAAAAASTVTKTAAAEAAKKDVAAYLNQYVVKPAVRTANKIEARSATKVAAFDAPMKAYIEKCDAAGQDAAAASTRRFVAEQRQLLSYRVVRCFEEGRYLLSGQYFKTYTATKALEDARYLTTLLCLFLISVVLGRQSVYPPIAPESPFALALSHKVNPNY